VHAEGAKGSTGNTASARADQPQAFADASAANGHDNHATSDADGCEGAPSKACAFSAAGKATATPPGDQGF